MKNYAWLVKAGESVACQSFAWSVKGWREVSENMLESMKKAKKGARRATPKGNFFCYFFLKQ
jgi:hypothetical protein